jgi:hypothetical protein
MITYYYLGFFRVVIMNVTRSVLWWVNFLLYPVWKYTKYHKMNIHPAYILWWVLGGFSISSVFYIDQVITQFLRENYDNLHKKEFAWFIDYKLQKILWKFDGTTDSVRVMWEYPSSRVKNLISIHNHPTTVNNPPLFSDDDLRGVIQGGYHVHIITGAPQSDGSVWVSVFYHPKNLDYFFNINEYEDPVEGVFKRGLCRVMVKKYFPEHVLGE